ncbi:MAG: amino acid racemase [bacterium]
MGRKVIGILGGMGPEATADLFLKIIRATPADKDQEHLRVIIDNNPQIPDRTAAIFSQGDDPLPLLVETAKNLARAGADFIVIPCNTAHYYYQELQAQCPLPVLNMIELCARRAREIVPALERIGLLATRGTVATGLYEKAFQQWGVQVLTPPEEEQERIMRVIYGVKAGRPPGELKHLWLPVVKGLVNRGVQAVVLGCTELPLVIDPAEVPVPVLDATAILAQEAVSSALN